ncbi:MAG: TonB-dependent receptor [Bacteroidaceae bacterium]|nr:TonB-dependent receptor [Bacteroidaceae bacterium]
MFKTLRSFWVAALLLFATVVSAQVTTSGMSGKLTDENKESIIGAFIQAVHQPSGSRYSTVTNTDGRFNIQGMRPGGPYEVNITYMGFKPKSVKNITLELGETYNMNIVISEDTKDLDELVVVGSSSKFAGEKTGASTNISNAQLESMPTISRSITDITRLSPYGGNGMNFAGVDGRTANFTVDGANFNNNFGLSDGLPGGGSPISIDAIEELQVVISPFDVRQTNFIGGGVNAITKSGTNTFKGTAYVHHHNENMRGDAVYGQVIPGARDTDRSTTYGATIGGPIIKDKLFFFANAEYETSPSVAVRWRPSVDGKASEEQYLSYTTVSDMERVQEFAKARYGYDTGSFTDFPADESNLKLLARVDWNINDRNKLAVRYNYTKNTAWNAPNVSSMDGGERSAFGRTSLYSMPFANSMYSMNNLVHSASLDLNSRITNNLSNQFLATFSKLDDVRGSNSSEFPFIDIHDGTNTTTQYMALGYELFTWNNAVHNTVLNIKDDITYYTGNHKITAGISYEYQMADNQYMRNGTGYYRYKSVDDFINGATPEVVCLTYGYDGEQAPAARVRFHKVGIYGQEEWNATDNFKLTAGLRLDGLFFNNSDLMTNNAIKELDYNGRHIDTGTWPGAQVSVSPRIGFVYDIMGDKSLKLRGGTGLFSGRLPLVFFTNMPTNGGMVQYQAQLGPKSNYNYLPDEVKAKYSDMSEVMAQFAGGLVKEPGKSYTESLRDKLVGMGFPNTVSPEDGTRPSSISAVDPNFKMPQVWKTSLAVDYVVPVSFPFTISAEGIFNKTINAATISDWSIMPVEGFARFNGADARPVYPSTFRSGTKAFVLENTSMGYGWSANVSMNMRPIKELELMASYTHTVSKEVTGLPGSNAESAFTYVPTVNGPNNIALHNSEYVTPNRVLAGLTFHKKNSHFSLIYEAWNGGYNYSYMTANDMNGDGYNYDALYIPTDEQVKNNEFRFVSADDRDRFMAFVHGDSYLSKNQGKYAEAYSVYNPWVHRVDMSYKHDFKIKSGKNMNTIQLSFDMKNVLNLFSSELGVSKTMNSDLNSGRILKYEGTDAEGYALFSTPEKVNANTQTWVPNYSIGQCWNISVGIKYMFN